MVSAEIRRALKSIRKELDTPVDDSRIRRLRNYALAIVSELSKDVENGFLTGRELTYVLVACSLFVELTFPHSRGGESQETSETSQKESL